MAAYLCRLVIRPLALLLALAVGAGQLLPAAAAPWFNRTAFAEPRFERVWRAADLAVQQGQTGRSWTWGPRPWFDYYEFYQQSPNGLRLVQYFDKARMELNDPRTTSGSLQGVTNGLLVVELVSGRLKLGDGIGPGQYEQREPATTPVAGDAVNENPDTPTYSSFRALATLDNSYRDPPRLGEPIGEMLNKSGALGFRQELASQPGTEIVTYEPVTGHNVPRVFEDFRHSLVGVSALDAFGYPITDAYWVRTRVAGQEQDVLVQLFERRVLTYTPANPAAWRVEMGNVGQHYFLWRYPHLGGLGQPFHVPNPYATFNGLLFASDRGSAELQLYGIQPDGNYEGALDSGGIVMQPFSILRSWSGRQERVFGELTVAGGLRQLVHARLLLVYPHERGVQRLLASSANDYHPAVSPDGTRLVFVSDRDGNPELYMLRIRPSEADVAVGGSGAVRLTQTVGCTSQHPSWLPDGSGLVYESDCQDGNFELYRASLSYAQDTFAELRLARLISPVAGESTRLTSTAADEHYPAVSPDGAQVVFSTDSYGNLELALQRLDSVVQTRLTTSPGVDEMPAWSPDGRQIAFASDRDGDFEIMVLDREAQTVRQLTSNTAQDRYVLWGQQP